MSLTREIVPSRVSAALDGRPTRWVPAHRLVGDYDGRNRTLEVFNADAGEQRDLLRRLRPLRQEVERLIGGPLIVVFHTRSETRRLYAADPVRLLLGDQPRDLGEPSPAEHAPDPSVADPPYEEAA